MRIHVLAPLAATLALAVAPGAPAAADDAVPGHAIVARTAPDALVIWDATADVTSIVKDKVSDTDAASRLERDALRVLASTADRLKRAKTVTVRVIYNKTGDVSPVYGSPTFAGVERFANLTVDAADVSGDKDKWRDLSDKAPVPAWVAFKIVGSLPPR